MYSELIDQGDCDYSEQRTVVCDQFVFVAGY